MKAKELIALLATDPEAEVLICPDTLKFDSIGLALWQKVNRAYKPTFGQENKVGRMAQRHNPPY